MSKINTELSRQVQKLVNEYFKEIDTKDLTDFINSFCYNQPAKRKDTSVLIEKFLEDNGLQQAFINYHYDLTNDPDFLRSSAAELDTLNEVRTCLLTLAFTRLQKAVIFEKANAAGFDFLKHELLSTYANLNDSEVYLYGKDTDKQMVKTITEIKHEPI